jgi:hypothetical protein
MPSENQFTALGPAEIGFQTDGSNIRMGASIAGREVGVVGHSDTGFGLEGTGGGGGVHGKGISQSLGGASAGPAVGVFGESVNDNGVRGLSVTSDGVAGITGAIGKSGVFGFNSAKNPTPPNPQFPGGPGPSNGFGVFGRCDLAEGAGVGGRSEGTDPVTGSGGVGVIGTSQAGDGVVGGSDANHKSGVFGFNTQPTGAAFGVSGTSGSPDGAGINGFSDPGIGVRGASKTNDGVVGSSSVERKSGVFGFNTQPTGAAFGVSGTSGSPDGAGINGFSDQGYGGRFSGGRAPLRLEPANTPGRPTTGNHQRGELFVDSNGDLFFCKDSGTPGNWFQVQLTPA